MSTATVGVLVAYTLVLLWLSRLGARRARDGGYLGRDRQFGSWAIFAQIATLWCSWILVVEFESAYLTGISAAWFGLSVGAMAVLVLVVMATPLRRLGYLTNSDLLGRRFGAPTRALSGAIIGITFPIFAMANVLAAAAFLHAILGIPLLATLVVTGAVIVGYVAAGGLWSLAYTQSANFVVLAVGLTVGVAFALRAAPFGLLDHTLPARSFSLGGAGLGFLVVQLFSLLLNVVGAQAEFQVLAAARHGRAVRRGIVAAVVAIVLVSLAAPVLGMAAAARVGSPHILGVVALPLLYLRHAPGAVTVVVALTIWAASLAWSAPLFLAGASSLGIDLLGARRRDDAASDARTRLVRWCLPIEAVLVILLASLRPDQLAWWQVFSFTIRNGALFAPVVAVFAWRPATTAGALASIVGGATSGLAWYAVTGFSATHFFLGIEPEWISAAVGMVLLVVVSLATAPFTVAAGATRRRLGAVAILSTIAAAIAIAVDWSGLERLGLTGPFLALGSTLLLAACAIAVERRGSPTEPADILAVDGQLAVS